MNFFEYLFCRLHWWFTSVIKEKDVPVFYSISALSVLYSFTIFPIYSLIYVMIFKSFYLTNIFNLNPLLIIAVIMYTINFIHFRKKRYNPLLKKFNKIDKSNKRKNDTLVIIYIVTVIIVNTILISYFRTNNLEVVG